MIFKKKIQIILERGAQKPRCLAPNRIAHAPLQLNIKWALFSFAPAKRSALSFGGFHKALYIYIYIYIYVCMYVCVCVCVREREREREKERERERERVGEKQKKMYDRNTRHLFKT